MKSVTLRIESCDECPHIKIERDYGEDSFEELTRWECMKEDKKNPKNILRWRDWYDHDKFIPKWCPLAVKRKKKEK